MAGHLSRRPHSVKEYQITPIEAFYVLNHRLLRALHCVVPGFPIGDKNNVEGIPNTL